MKKAYVIAISLALAATSLVACGKTPVAVEAPKNDIHNAAALVDVDADGVKTFYLANNNAEQEKVEGIPEEFYNVNLEETVQLGDYEVKVYSYVNDGLPGFFLMDQLGHTYNLYGEDEYAIVPNASVSFGSTERFDDATYLWVSPTEYGFMTVCHPNK